MYLGNTPTPTRTCTKSKFSFEGQNRFSNARSQELTDSHFPLQLKETTLHHLRTHTHFNQVHTLPLIPVALMLW